MENPQEFLFKRFIRDQQRLVILRRDSHSEATRSKVAETLPGPLDFLFIDGDHSYEGVKADFEMYSSLVRKGVMIAFHDIAHRDRDITHHDTSDYGVMQFWNEIKPSYRNREIIHSPQSNPMGIGVLWI